MTECPVPDCGVAIPREHLMCRKHWYQVPKPLRNAVWKAYKGGMGQDWLDARADAIASVVMGQ